MKTENPVTIYLQDYQPPDYSISHSELAVTLDFTSTIVEARHNVIKNNADAFSLVLNAECMEIQAVSINAAELSPDGYEFADDRLIIFNTPDRFQLSIKNRIDPAKNTALSGLYKSGDMLCSQCEAEGYRRITPAIDRPDNLTEYTVRLIADKSIFPTLLCNGNPVESGDLDAKNHFVVWHDPYPKPTYLFAIIAGRLGCLEDTFLTMSNREVLLRFYARDKDVDKCGHAMSSLKRAMAWDEKTYGREYDLDLFNVVAVDDFNMGAMENKGLNVFNTKYVLADPAMATDDDFDNVESVIGHEYFHNWSGNRVTLRDWFQLSLKEGFTVFRDQEFSADMGSAGVKRIEDVNILRSHQFEEDSSPMAHPVRPDSYQEINNFYTATVYNKGAEVVRMARTLVGEKTFRKGTDHYFQRYDGQAVTTDDFIASLEFASGEDMTQFKRWYSQAGTPVVTVKTDYSAKDGTYRLTMKQSCPQTPGQREKKPFVIPVKTSLLNKSGAKFDLGNGETESVLRLDRYEKVFEFNDIAEKPVPSLLREFSAPVDLRYEYSAEELQTLLNHDDDPFNRWEAGQNLYLRSLLTNIARYRSGKPFQFSGDLSKSFVSILHSGEDGALLAKLLTLPSRSYLAEKVPVIDPQGIEITRKSLKSFLADSALSELLDCFHRSACLNNGRPDADEIQARSLRDVCLGCIASLDDEQAHDLCLNQLQTAKCMTDAATAMALIAQSSYDGRDAVLTRFYENWKNEPLVIDKWLSAQARAAKDDTLERVKLLTEHPGFDFRNPNKVYALILGFTHGNACCFHAENGSGYEFLLQWVEKLDPVNPQVCARLVSALNSWKKYKPELKAKMQNTLNNILSLPDLSKDVREIVNKNLV